ncbi:hypothetical protein BPAE_0101g00320 [Botrytis paeoniae]|uniref:Uncharacterized protein n=1 Tax=Botrytis paeoniae TaxID=278948 RepID=A0A4Z1FI60_9HELO|nr:hypothetical protein BPAE_0101g00320 [Botrytis paeoniae]
MVLSLVQYRIFQVGVPIGSLFIAFRITELTSLLSPEFWAALTADRSLEGHWWNFPFSKDSFLPGTDFGPWLPNESSYQTGAFRAETSFNELWPNRIDRSYSYSSVCGFSNKLFTEQCPAGGYSVIQTWARTQKPYSVNDS